MALVLWAAEARAADADPWEAFDRHQRLGRTGAALVGAGAAVGLAYPGVATWWCANTDHDSYGCLAAAVRVGIPIEGGALATTLGGEGMLFAGGAQAARDSGRSAGLSWVGAGLVVAGTGAIAAVAPGKQDADVPIGIAGAAAIVAGTGLGVARLVGNAAEARGAVSVAPAPNGVVVSGRF